MERALQERVIGAIVLVIFIVLVVPVFLDGPSTDLDTISETVVLPGQNAQQRKRQTIVLERDRTEPVPQPPAPDNGNRSETPAPAAESAPATVTPRPPPTAKVEVKPVEPAPTPGREPEQSSSSLPASAGTSTGMWAVQLGSFSRKDNAERLAAQLRQKGYAAFISQLQGSNGPLHRVRIGPQKDRDSAQAVVARLAKDSQKGQVVPHP